MQCLTIAIENPPERGEYRVFNQFEEVYDVTELALKVQKVGFALGLDVEVRNLENPRKEMDEHYYNPDHNHLLDLGYQPTHDVEAELKIMLADLLAQRDRISRFQDVLIPDIRWDGHHRKSTYLEVPAPAR
jgi:UDP-sulfoquinovose synthase